MMEGTSSGYLRHINLLSAFRGAESFYKYGVEHSQLPIIDYCLKKMKFDGLVLEFGVWTGTSTNFIAEKIAPKELHAFDSFKGLETEWNGLPKDFFTVDPSKISFRPNVKIHNGYFKDSIPEFLTKYNKPISFINIDCDLCSSTETVLFTLNNLIVPGTIIYFDELYNYPKWEEGEYNALLTWAYYNFKREFRYIAYNDDKGVAIEVLK